MLTDWEQGKDGVTGIKGVKSKKSKALLADDNSTHIVSQRRHI